ncbi:bactofilin family protein [Chitinophaga nivalis]|uniref:Polymer-forming cytoskeletal protein n=1 Tax=Chitinophaga nivalis TaxID=2991709 RepID=A0ABT3IRY9_9BACT|nr:polymer-forming cytoskeletal protein [Chitinophaga nivalis]MCW3463572.1 polymer-forming cytoskeletal protein [Chitinophaga nivalis]MCW3486738.1 polymer-forming cytoskeletal protein [Chitinophaga nivalis]
MFNNNQKSKGDNKSLLPTSTINIIGNGTTIQGDIVCEGDIRIDGQVTGLVSTKAKIVVGPEGDIIGDLVCQSADILGKVTGIIKVDDLLFLKGNALVKGDVYTAHFEMEPTAKFNGRCYMDGQQQQQQQPAENQKNGKAALQEAK